MNTAAATSAIDAQAMIAGFGHARILQADKHCMT
jgi:hypothetical protein